MTEFDDSIQLPIEFFVKSDGGLKESIAKIKQQLKMAEDSFNTPAHTGVKGTATYQQVELADENLLNMKRSNMETIASIKQTVEELGKLSPEIVEAKKEYEDLARIVRVNARALYGTASERERELGNIRRMNAAQKRYNELVAKAKEDVKEHLKEVEKQSTAVQEQARDYKSMLKQVGKDGMYVENGRASKAVHRGNEQELRLKEELKAKQDEINEKYAKQAELIERGSKAYKELVRQHREELNALNESYRIKLLKLRAARGNEDAERELAKIQRQQTAEIKQQISAKQKEIAAVKESTSRWYYKLRSIKMLGFVVKDLDTKMTALGKKSASVAVNLTKRFLKLTNIFTTFGGAVKRIGGFFSKFSNSAKKTSSSLKTVNKHLGTAVKNTKEINKAQKGVDLSLKDIIKNVLKYGLGIRSLFVLFNKLRSAMVSGFENMAPQFDKVNKQLSSVVTSFLQMKNAIAGAVQPILNVLAPALEKLSAILSEVGYKVASFIAALTGQKTVYKAIRYQIDYADSLDKTKNKAKEAKKELSGLDKLNVLTTDKDKNGDDNSVKKMFEEVPVDTVMEGWADKFKKWLAGLFEPFKKAWLKEGKFVMDAWKTMLKSVKALLKAIKDDFEKVWKSDTMVQVWANLLHILGDIFLIIGKIADGLLRAWKHNDNGYKILSGIAEILKIITGWIRQAADYTVIWAGKLDFIPLFDALATTLWEKIIPAVDKIMEFAVYMYETFFLEFVKHFIESIAPKLIKAAGSILAAVGNIAHNLTVAFRRCHSGKRIVDSLKKIFDRVADAIVHIAESTEEWSKKLKFFNLVDAIEQALKDCVDPVDKICTLLEHIWDNVVEPLATYVIEKALPKAITIIGKVATLIGTIVGKLDEAFTNTNAWKRIVESLEGIFDTILQAIEDIVDATIEWANNTDFEPLIESIAGFFEKMQKPVEQICSLLTALYKEVILPIAGYFIENTLPGIVDLAGDIGTTIGDIAENVKTAFSENERGQRILGTIKEIADKIGGVIKFCSEKTKEWAENVDFGPLVESLANFLDSCKEPIGFISDTFGKFYTDVLLPFWNYIVEEGLPYLLDTLKDINNSIDWDKLKKKIDEFMPSFEQFLEKGWEALVKILGDVGQAIADFINSPEFDAIVDKLIEWMDNANPYDMAKGLEDLVKKFIEFKGALAFGAALLSGLTGVMTFLNFIKNFTMGNKVKSLTGEIKTLNDTLTTLSNTAGPTKTAMGDAASAAGKAAEAAASSANATGKVAMAGKAAEGTAAAASKGILGASAGVVAGLAAMDLAIIGFDVYKYTKIQRGLEETNDEHKDAVERYCDSLTQIYEKGGQEALNKVTGSNDSLETAMQKARDEYEKQPKNLWDAWKKSWSETFDAAGGMKDTTDHTFKGVVDGWIHALFGSSDTPNPETAVTNDMGKNSAEGYFVGYNEVWEQKEPELIKGFNDIVTDGEKELQIQSPSKKTESMGKFTAEGFFKGFKDIWDKFDFKKKFSELTKKAKDTLNGKTLNDVGKTLIKGLQSGINSAFGPLKSAASKGINDIKNKFRTGLTASSLTSVGRNLINGLKSGLTSALNSALQTVTSICNQITAKARQAFQTHSPSKVFMKIGENLMQGLVVGVDEDADDVEKSFNDLVPSDDMLKSFYNKFMSMMSRLTNNVTKMFDSMFNHINKSMNSLSKLANLNELNKKLSKMNYEAPSISRGESLPTNKDFTQNLSIEMDWSKLPDIMKKAFVDALTETANLQTDDETIIVNIDGKEVFQAVRSHDAMYKKQHGQSAFA